MKRLICLFKEHKPYVDLGEEVEPGVFVGPSCRYCGRCGKILPGDKPQVGDRRFYVKV